MLLLQRKYKRCLLGLTLAVCVYVTLLSMHYNYREHIALQGLFGILPMYKTKYAARYMERAGKRKPENMSLNKISVMERTRPSITTVTGSLNHLLSEVIGKQQTFSFIRTRVTATWKYWKQVGDVMSKITQTKPRRILLFPSFLSGTNFVQMATKGGPLGELVQWSDLIAALHILNHKVHITLGAQFKGMHRFDLIYTDVGGAKALEKRKKYKEKLKCRLRVLDVFGTRPQYNDPVFAQAHGLVTGAGMLGLVPEQFLTLLPHTSDNSFLGVTIPKQNGGFLVKKNQAVIYGKEIKYWKKSQKLIKLISKYFYIHATVNTRSLPKFVVNHGILPQQNLRELLKESKLFVGLGEPIEGPAPLEAIALGCVYINPKYDTPYKFVNKPTDRMVNSQNDYAENKIGKPYVYTVNINNLTEVEEVLQIVRKKNNFIGFTPFELTHLGFTQRLDDYINRQHFCDSKIPEGFMPKHQLVITDLDQNCDEKCQMLGKICHRPSFPYLKPPQFNYSCRNIVDDALIAPGVSEDNTACYKDVEKNSNLNSCAYSRNNVRRFCPCIDRTLFTGNQE